MNEAGCPAGPVTRVCGARRQPTDPLPLISVVTVVRNAVDAIVPLLKSVIEHERRPFFEWIVIDGASTDGTVELLSRHQNNLDYWISEPDGGIYDAMTKGIHAARGEFIYHLNVGDRLLLVPVEELERALWEGIDIAAFRVAIDGRPDFVPTDGYALRHQNTIHHQGAFYRRSTFAGYDLRYRIFADFDVNQRMLFSGARLACYEPVVAAHSTDGVSNHSGAREFFEIIRRNCGSLDVVVAFLKCKVRGVLARSAQLRRRTGV
jgi:glycosyltransferase involved in cell wall biosynthesis